MVDALHRLGAREIWREAGRVHAHVPADPGQASELRLRAEVRAALAAIDRFPFHALEGDVQIVPVDADKVGRTGILSDPVRVSSRLVVRVEGGPSAPDGSATVVLGPGAAFGSMEHPTTRSCLRLLDSRVRAGDHVVDVGTGSGILAVAAVRLGATRVDAIESDAVAREAAERNVARNGVTGSVRIIAERATRDSLRARRARWLERGEPLPDGVAANLLPDLLVELAPALAELPGMGGWLIVSGVPIPECPRVQESLTATGARLFEQDRSGGWWSAVFEVPSTQGTRGSDPG